jgi:sigma54-dependent transcription regulator
VVPKEGLLFVEAGAILFLSEVGEKGESGLSSLLRLLAEVYLLLWC